MIAYLPSTDGSGNCSCDATGCTSECPRNVRVDDVSWKVGTYPPKEKPKKKQWGTVNRWTKGRRFK